MGREAIDEWGGRLQMSGEGGYGMSGEGGYR